MISEKRLQELEGAWQVAGKMGVVPLVGADLKALVETIRDLQGHCNAFCKCPSHGPSLIQTPDGEVDE